MGRAWKSPRRGRKMAPPQSSAPFRGCVNLAVPPRLAPWAMFFRSYELWFTAFPDPPLRVAHPPGRPSHYLIGKTMADPLAIAGEVWPPTEMAIGCGPELRPDGTWMSIWYSATQHGARNAFGFPFTPNTVACLPPMVTVTGLVVCASGDPDAGSPLDCGVVTGPRPLA